jgi:NhaA family Na+:H+ antiporter
MPNRKCDEGIFAESGSHYTDTLNKFEHQFKLPVDFGLFGFGLANAGVQFSSTGNATIAVFLSLAAGKTLGIFSFSMIGHALGFKLPDGMGWRSLLVAGATAGLGLTVALFVAGVAFTEPSIQGAAKMGALFSAFIAPLAILLGYMLRVRNEYEQIMIAKHLADQEVREFLFDEDRREDEGIERVDPHSSSTFEIPELEEQEEPRQH